MMVSNKNFLFSRELFSGAILVFFGGGGRFLELGICSEVGHVLFIIENSTLYSIVRYSFSMLCW